VWVENRSDELWIGVKGLSNLQIAGSPRNSFRASLWQLAGGGRATEWDMGLSGYPTQSNSEYHQLYPGSQSTGDKVRGREGNNPDRRLRSQIHAKC
jgi:hypothetical protein